MATAITAAEIFVKILKPFDGKSEQRSRNHIRFDSILSPRIYIANVQYDCRAVRRFDETNKWYSKNHPALSAVRWLYHHRGTKRAAEPALFGATNFTTIYRYSYRHELRILGRVTIRSLFDGIDNWVTDAGVIEIASLQDASARLATRFLPSDAFLTECVGTLH